MNLRLALFGLLAGSATAFTPQQKPFGLTKKSPTTNSPLLLSDNEKTKNGLWRPPMNMVAGGAEKAYGDEYYDGTLPILSTEREKSRIMSDSRIE